MAWLLKNMTKLALWAKNNDITLISVIIISTKISVTPRPTTRNERKIPWPISFVTLIETASPLLPRAVFFLTCPTTWPLRASWWFHCLWRLPIGRLRWGLGRAPLLTMQLPISACISLAIAYYATFYWRLYFILAAITDWIDGYFARKLNMTSAFGRFLDPVADKLMVAAALIILVQWHPDIVMAISAIVIISREIAVSALREWMAELGNHYQRCCVICGQMKPLFKWWRLRYYCSIGSRLRRWVIYYWWFQWCWRYGQCLFI